ncbi:hypothetical protein CUMW_193960 [Citrus unshiu]|uniref:Uncharacterized protein n=1 Tax=Citrus unshiu TaxID=55188 RepID=A0A2H5Q487_CITUN|nr:hypothetical protein CUMW_193960 [Citrus unshiu]
MPLPPLQIQEKPASRHRQLGASKNANPSASKILAKNKTKTGIAKNKNKSKQKMGNCIRHQHQPSMQWAGDDWGAVVESASNHRTEEAKQEGLLLGGDKIKITKKQLEELLGKADVKGLSVQQVLAHLINVNVSSSNDRYHETNQRSWRPALQSIPEDWITMEFGPLNLCNGKGQDNKTAHMAKVAKV